MPDDAPLRQLLAEGAAQLRSTGIGQPRREAREIWADLVGVSAAEVLLHADRPVSQSEREGFLGGIARRAAGEPLAYVTGFAGFRRLLLRSDARALIPRPETEGLVELALSRVPQGNAVDVGTGSGCIALALRDEGGYDSVAAVDRSSPALALARENVTRTGLPLELVQGDLLSAFGPTSMDLVVSNPPYLTRAELTALDPSVRDWEPASALVSGVDGLDATRELIAQSGRVLRRDGWLALEVDSSRAALVADLCHTSLWDGSSVHLDLFGRARYVLARRSEMA